MSSSAVNTSPAPVTPASAALSLRSGTHRPYEQATTEPVAFHETLVTCSFCSRASGYDSVCKHTTWKRSDSSTAAAVPKHIGMRSGHAPARGCVVPVLASPLPK